MEDTASTMRSNRHFWQRFLGWFLSPDPGQTRIRELQKRALWMGFALIFQTLAELDLTAPGSVFAPLVVLLPMLLYIASFFAIWQAVRPQSTKPFAKKQRLLTFLVALLTIPGVFLFGRGLYLSFQSPIGVYSNDGTSLDMNAAYLLLEGRNPYTETRFEDIAQRFQIKPTWTTPLRQGVFADRLEYPSNDEITQAYNDALRTGDSSAFETKVSYPAISFLTLIPFALFHLNALGFYLLCYLILFVLAWFVVRKEMRPWLILLSLGNIPMWDSTTGGNLDILYILLIMPAWIFANKRWTSALFLGLAIACKQTAWFIAPFYLIMVWRQYGFKECFGRGLIAGGVAVLVNLPFILWDPQAWLAGTLAPLVDPMFPLGVGIVRLSTDHIIPYLPSSIYMVIELLTMAVALIFYWRVCRTRPAIAFLLATLPLFMAWRSLPSYFACIILPAFILLAARPRVVPTTRQATTEVNESLLHSSGRA